MESVNLKEIEVLSNSKEVAKLKADTVLDSIQKLHIEFELNPKSLGQELIGVLDKIADEFASIIHELISASDRASKKLGEMSLKIVKLCVRLQNKIFFVYNRRTKSLSFS